MTPITNGGTDGFNRTGSHHTISANSSPPSNTPATGSSNRRIGIPPSSDHDGGDRAYTVAEKPGELTASAADPWTPSCSCRLSAVRGWTGGANGMQEVSGRGRHPAGSYLAASSPRFAARRTVTPRESAVAKLQRGRQPPLTCGFPAGQKTDASVAHWSGLTGRSERMRSQVKSWQARQPKPAARGLAAGLPPLAAPARLPGSCHPRATRGLRRLPTDQRGGPDQVIQSRGDGGVPPGHHVLVAHGSLRRGVAHARHQLPVAGAGGGQPAAGYQPSPPAWPSHPGPPHPGSNARPDNPAPERPSARDPSVAEFFGPTRG